MRYARICPNTNGWTSPSGGNKWSNGSFPGKDKFGFDEWLLGMPVVKSGKFKGYKAGFIQGFKSQKTGFFTDVSCYWLDAYAVAHLAVEIKNCQKLGDSDALDICREYKSGKPSFIESMNAALKRESCSAPIICDPLDLLNVVFLPDNARLIMPPGVSPVAHKRYSKLWW